MKKYGNLIKITIFLFILLGLAKCSYATDEIIKVDVMENTFDNVLNVVNILMVLVNFGFVVFVFNNEKKQNQKNDVRKYNEHWYDKFIIDNNITLADDFFEEVEKLIKKVSIDIKNRNSNGENIDVLKYSEEVFIKWTTLHNECKSKFCEKIDVVMPDFSAELRKDFSKLQDYISNKLNEIILCQNNESVTKRENETINKLYEIKKVILKKIYLKGMPKEK